MISFWSSVGKEDNLSSLPPWQSWLDLDGFFLDQNESEVVYLDDIILHNLNASDQDELKHREYYG